ncbi:MAG: FAD-dependent oxidoreductase [Oscillospiraceae bacterium]|nr:FAD-dependent oxidoreductase [Oscillospiraceae bacterium]
MENRSVWADVRMPEYPALKGELRTDVLIVGGGIAGLLAAHELKESGFDCTVVERGRICRGTTGKTTAKVTFQHGLIYQKIAGQYGLEKAHKYLMANRSALGRIAALAKNIDCDFRKADGYIYSKNDRKALEREIRVLERIGYSAEFCERVDLPLPAVGAVKFPNQAVFDPLKFLRGIVSGIRIFENTHVREIHGTTALCSSGRVIAKKVIIATHFPFIDRVGCYYLKMYQNRSSVIALENSPRPEGFYMDADTNGMSFRSVGDLLLIGGGAHRTGDGCRMNELTEFAEEQYPGAKVKYAWSAQDCITLDGLPYIGQYSALTPDWYVLTGFNKWGITTAMAGAEIVRDLILEGKSRFADVFDPSRSIFKKQLLFNGLNAVKDLLSINAPRCTHMGCALKRNRAEHSWDCPCHGSRFSGSGELLEGPSNKNL